MTVVYLDRVVLLNLAVDYLLLLATARLAGLPLRRGRLGLCAALGAAYAAAVFLPGCRGLAHPLCRLAAGTAMCRLAWLRERRPWRLTALFFLLSGALAGLLLAVRSDYVKVGSITYPRILLALTPGAVSDGGGYQALWGGRKERRHGESAAAASAVAQRPAG